MKTNRKFYFVEKETPKKNEKKILITLSLIVLCIIILNCLFLL